MRNIAFVLTGWIGSYVLGIFLAVNNVTGLRGPPLDGNPFVHANQDHADITVVFILGFLAILTTVASFRWPRMRAAAMGIWLGVISAAIMIELR